MSTLLRVIGAGLLLVVLLVVLFTAWYWVAADYGYGAVSGVYMSRRGGETSTLFLRKDRSFEQIVTRNGRTDRVRGSWKRIGEGGIVFSRDFLRLQGQADALDDEYYGIVKKRFTLIPSIHLKPDPGGPVLDRVFLIEADNHESQLH